MKYAILADIHSNLEALDTADAWLKKHQISHIFHLGDVVGYGANPNECFDWVLQNAEWNLMGNHERAVVDIPLREWFNPLAREAIEWTAQILETQFVKGIADLPYVRIQDTLTYTHGSLHQPEQFHYLRSYEDAIPTFTKMETPICFSGHTHIPSCFRAKDFSATYLKPCVVQLVKGERYVLNPGSLGQPRDRDTRLSFGIFDDEELTFEIIRLEYDNHKAAKKIRRAKLPGYFADRLL